MKSQVCWSVGASATISLKTALISKLLGELQASVTVNVLQQTCQTYEEFYEFQVPISDCFKNFAREVWKKKQVNGTLYVYPEVLKCYYTTPSEPVPSIYAELKCSPKKATGSAESIVDHTIQFSPFPTSCGGPVYPAPDPYGGKRSEKCCSPLLGCDTIPEGGHSCCSCYTTE